MKPPRPPLIRVAIAVIERDGRLLITRRLRGSHLAGCWEFPGGKQRPGERAAACVRREVREELGIEARVTGALPVLTYAYPERIVRLRAFRCRIVRGEPSGLNGQQVRWVSRAQLGRLRLPPANRPLLAALRVTRSAAERRGPTKDN